MWQGRKCGLRGDRRRRRNKRIRRRIIYNEGKNCSTSQMILFILKEGDNSKEKAKHRFYRQQSVKNGEEKLRKKEEVYGCCRDGKGGG